MPTLARVLLARIPQPRLKFTEVYSTNSLLPNHPHTIPQKMNLESGNSSGQPIFESHLNNTIHKLVLGYSSGSLNWYVGDNEHSRTQSVFESQEHLHLFFENTILQ